MFAIFESQSMFAMVEWFEIITVNEFVIRKFDAIHQQGVQNRIIVEFKTVGDDTDVSLGLNLKSATETVCALILILYKSSVIEPNITLYN
jgi:hypothetical protein